MGLLLHLATRTTDEKVGLRGRRRFRARFFLKVSVSVRIIIRRKLCQ